MDEPATNDGASQDRSVNVTDGRLFKPLLLLSAPIVLAQTLDIIYFLVDFYWIGHLGTDAVTAMSYSWPIFFLVTSLGLGMVTAGTILVAQHKGNSRLQAVRSAAGGTISFVTILSLVLTVVGYLLAPWLLTVVGATSGTEPHTLAVAYMRITFLGVMPMFWFFTFDALSRGWGDTRTPLKLMALSASLNVLIDPFLIHGFAANPLFEWAGLQSLQLSLYDWTGFAGHGIQGAAMATIFSRGVAAVLGLYILFSGRLGFKLTFDSLKLQRSTLAGIVSIGTPTAVEMGVRAGGVAILTRILAIEGDAAVAAYGLADYLAGVLFVISLGLARGVETTVAQNIGANQLTRAKHAVYLSSGVAVALFVLIVAAAYPNAESIISVFLSVQGGTVAADAIIENAAAFIWIVGPALVFFAVFQVTLGAFRGSGNTKLAMLMATLELFVFRIPLSYVALVSFDAGITGVWYAIATSYIVSTLIAVAWFFRGTWVPSSSLPIGKESSGESPDGTDLDRQI